MSCKRPAETEIKGDSSLLKRLRAAEWRTAKYSRVVLLLGPEAEEYDLPLYNLAHIEYFGRYSESIFDDLEKGSPTVINLPDFQCDKEIFRIVEDCCYVDVENIEMSTSNIVRLFSASKFLEMDRLQSRIGKFLEENVFNSWENCLNVLATFDGSTLPSGANMKESEETVLAVLFAKCLKAFLSSIATRRPECDDEWTMLCNVECLLRVAEVLPVNVAKHIYQSVRAEQYGLFLNLGRHEEFICKHIRGLQPFHCSYSFGPDYDKELVRWVEQLPHRLPNLTRRSLLVLHLSETINAADDVTYTSPGICSTLLHWRFLCAFLVQVRVICSSGETGDLISAIDAGTDWLEKKLSRGLSNICTAVDYDVDLQGSAIVEQLMKMDCDILQIIVDHLEPIVDPSIDKIASINRIAEILDCCIGKHLQAETLTTADALEIYDDFPNNFRDSHMQLYQTLTKENLSREEVYEIMELLDDEKIPDDMIEKLFEDFAMDSQRPNSFRFERFGRYHRRIYSRRYMCIQRGKLELELKKVSDLKESNEKLELKRVSDLKESNEKLVHLHFELAVRSQELLTVTEAKSLVDSERDALQKDLEEEKEKSTCQICFLQPRDALSLPCMHFHYCSDCLNEYHRQRKECPTCRGFTSGVLKCII